MTALAGGKLAANRRSALVQSLIASKSRRVPLTSTPSSPQAFDFGTLPDYQQLRVQRAAADFLGIESPFFREIDGAAGPTCQIEGRELLNFSSYDYLGLNHHDEVRAAAHDAIDTYGVSVSASRVVAGERDLHRRLETALARFLGTEDAVAMVSGHAVNVTTIGRLLGPKDAILVDGLIHNSIVEGARLSGAARITFPHNDLDWVEDFLTRRRADFNRVLIAVEGLYSMDGDWPDLARLVEIKSRHNSWLMVDEAHSLGVLGATGRGIAEAQGVDPGAVELWMGTLSKTLASCGGYIAGSRALVEYLKTTAPGFVYSVGLAAPLAAAATAALEVLAATPELVARLNENGARFLKAAQRCGLDTGLSRGASVIPVLLGDSAKAAVLSDRLRKAGVNALPITFPAVPEKSARLRFFITSAHSAEQIDRAVEVTANCLLELEANPPKLSLAGA